MTQAASASVSPTSSQVDATPPQYPTGIPFIVGNEAAERFSFYGMKAILYAYLTQLYLQFQDMTQLAPEVVAEAKARATQTNHLFIAGVYAFPLVGAAIADRWLGKYAVILWVSLLYCVGHAVLAVAGRAAALGAFDTATWLMYAGLATIALGAGGIKPCVSANVGDQFTDKNRSLISSVYQIFYYSINFGSFFANLLIPYINRKYGAEIAFGLPGILMALATLVFWLGRDRFVRIPATPGGRLGRLDALATTMLFTPVLASIVALPTLEQLIEQLVSGGAHSAGSEHGTASTLVPLALLSIAGVVVGLWLARRRQSIEKSSSLLPVLQFALKTKARGQSLYDAARKQYDDEAAEQPAALGRILLVFSMLVMFWALFDQHSSTFVEQASQMQLLVNAPKYTWYVALSVLVGGAVFAGAWLALIVSNAKMPKSAVWATLGAVALGFVGAGIADASFGQRVEFTMVASQLSSLNPLLIMILIPLTNVLVWNPLQKRGIELKPVQKMGIGMFLTAASFAVAALVQSWVESAPPGSVSAFWQTPQYVLLTAGEILVSAVGLEFAYTQAPRAMKSTVSSLFYLTITFGNLVVAALAPLQAKLPLSQFFWLFCGLMTLASVIFAVIASQYRGKTYLQQSAK